MAEVVKRRIEEQRMDVKEVSCAERESLKENSLKERV